MRIALAGLGTVGAGVIKLLQRQGALRLPGEVSVVAVSARNRSRDRGVDVSAMAWFDDPVALARSADADVFVELIGGADGPAKAAVEAALGSGKHVVTANKALMAAHGASLAALAEARGLHLLFEAAVAGGVPIVRAMRESLAGVEVSRVAGILNGTCNYILTEMERSGRAYPEVLAQAQALGYAEADPTLDVSGMDALQKAVLLGAIAFGAAPDASSAHLQGIERIELADLILARRLGYRIKLIAGAWKTEAGVACDVAPTLLPFGHPLANVDDALNAVVVDAEPVGRLTFIGAGAGEGATASAVVGDIGRLADARPGPVFGAPVAALTNRFVSPEAGAAEQAYYIRVRLKDRPGALAGLTSAFARAGVSVDSMVQDPGRDGGALVGVISHPCAPEAARSAVAFAAEAGDALDAPLLVRVETLHKS